MSLAHENDTIAARATPAGEGGIGVVRLSGADAIKIASGRFKGRSDLIDVASHTAHYGEFVGSDGKTIDSVIALVFKKPHSYTGEDSVEISCHGGEYLVRRILGELLQSGARAAGPGEFTKRAFLNGRLDLVQAEAVADLIRARSAKAHQSSILQLEGRLSEKLSQLREQLIETIGLMELELDFAEDGYEFADKGVVCSQINQAIEQIDQLLQTYRVGRVFRDGVRVTLVGAPNVGKSSLLNALLRQDRAIVTDIPGTTRDVIEEAITVGGVVFNLSDTAGLRETQDLVEKEGVRRAEKRLEGSDLLIVILDGSRSLANGEAELVEKLVRFVESTGFKCIIAVNKTDLVPMTLTAFPEIRDLLSRHTVVGVSAKTASGIRELEAAMVDIVSADAGEMTEASVVVTNLRHVSILERANQSLRLALESALSRKSSEFIVVDLRAALNSLGEIVGTVTTDDILNAIFDKFCIGK